MAKKAAKVGLTKQEVAKARADVRAARGEMRAANRKLRAAKTILFKDRIARHPVRKVRKANGAREDRRFLTWRHDFETLLQTHARSSEGSPESLVMAAALGADRMAAMVAERRPREFEERRHGVVRVRLARGMSQMGAWYQWQTLFDACVHAMCERSDYTALDVVTRACDIADIASKIVRERFLAVHPRTAAA